MLLSLILGAIHGCCAAILWHAVKHREHVVESYVHVALVALAAVVALSSPLVGLDGGSGH